MKTLAEILVVAIVLVAFAVPIYAADIAVDAQCSLADAITAANSDRAAGGCPAGAGADVIRLSANVRLRAALPRIDSELTIEGNGHHIVGRQDFRILGITRRGHLELNNITISNGKSDRGGAIANSQGSLIIRNSVIRTNSAKEGGAIASNGTLTIYNSAIFDNIAEKDGGAIVNAGALSIHNSTIFGNIADKDGGAIHNAGGDVLIEATVMQSNFALDDGGAMYNSRGKVNIRGNSVFQENWARQDGGAVYNLEGAIHIRNATFRANSSAHSGADGGAIYSKVGEDNDNLLTINNSAFMDNSALGRGGAIYIDNVSVTINNSTFLNNSAGGLGGAILNLRSSITISSSTFFGNSTDADSANGSIIYSPGKATTYLRATIIANSVGGKDCIANVSGLESVLNLIEDGSCFAEFMGDPEFGPLVEPEDGSPPYLPLLPGSPAIDSFTELGCLVTDQIGRRRPQGAACDLGAVEFMPDS